MGVIAIFLAKLVDPIGGITALVVGALFGGRIGLVTGAIAGAVVLEVMLQSMQEGREFSIGIVLIGVVAMACWAAVGTFAIRPLFARRG